MSFFLKDWRQIELRATVLIVVEIAPSEISRKSAEALHFTDTALLIRTASVSAAIIVLVIERHPVIVATTAAHTRLAAAEVTPHGASRSVQPGQNDGRP